MNPFEGAGSVAVHLPEPFEAGKICWRERRADAVQVGLAQPGSESKGAVGEDVFVGAWTEYRAGLGHGSGAQVHEVSRGPDRQMNRQLGVVGAPLPGLFHEPSVEVGKSRVPTG